MFPIIIRKLAVVVNFRFLISTSCWIQRQQATASEKRLSRKREQGIMDITSLQNVLEMTQNTSTVQFLEIPDSLILNPLQPISR